MLLVGLLQNGHGHAHVRGQRSTAFVVLHHATARVVLAMPNDLVAGRLVQAQPERRLAFPHLAGYIVAAAQLVREALAVGIQDQAADAAQSLCGQKFDLGIGIVGLDQARRVHLDPLEVDRLAANGLAHLDAVTSAVLAIGGRQVHQVRTVLCQ